MPYRVAAAVPKCPDRPCSAGTAPPGGTARTRMTRGLASGSIRGHALSFPRRVVGILGRMGYGVVMTGGGRRAAAWYAGFAVYAAGVALFSGPGLDHWWGTWAAGGYAAAAVIAAVTARSAGAGRARGGRLAIAVSLAGALAAPALWLMTKEPTPPDVAVVARSGALLLHHGTPYLPAAALSAGGWLAYNPYLPVMALFGLPGALGVPGKTWPWLIAGTFLLLYATFRVTLAPRAGGSRRAALG